MPLFLVITHIFAEPQIWYFQQSGKPQIWGSDIEPNVV
jgi:hypothetical protein